MRLPAFTRTPHPADRPGRSVIVPTSARAVGWFWLAGVPIGLVTGVMDFVQFLQGGDLSIALPVGVGLSGWSIGRGLLRGNRYR